VVGRWKNKKGKGKRETGPKDGEEFPGTSKIQILEGGEGRGGWGGGGGVLQLLPRVREKFPNCGFRKGGGRS